jgi:putative ABC transport system ATP-binding protein
MRIRLDSVGKDYVAGDERQTVLADINLAFDSGSFVVLLGRSGSGKSTLLNLIAGFDAPDRGRIRIGESCVSALPERERTLFRRRHLGVVFQAYNLLPTLTVAENVQLPLELLGASAADGRTVAGAMLEALGLGAYGGRFPEELSGGEQQRVAIARALVHRPAIVLADEPTGNLDLATAQRVLALLDDACREHGATLVMATHSPEVVGRADAVYEVGAGDVARR